MKPKVILIADDEPSDREAARRALEKARILNTIRCVGDGLEAIAYLEGTGPYSDRVSYPYPELILLDLKMPKQSGLDVLKWLQAHEAHHEVGIIVLTAADNLRELSQAYRLGAHSFLTKPLQIEEFLNLLSGLKGLRLEPLGDGRILGFETTHFHELPTDQPRL